MLLPQLKWCFRTSFFSGTSIQGIPPLTCKSVPWMELKIVTKALRTAFFFLSVAKFVSLWMFQLRQYPVNTNRPLLRMYYFFSIFVCLQIVIRARGTGIDVPVWVEREVTRHFSPTNFWMLFGISTLFTLTSVCIFSILFSIRLLRCRQGEFV